MEHLTDIILVLSMIPTTEEATIIGRRVVEDKLAACVNIVPGVRSFFFWKGALCDENEVLLMMKSCQDVFSDLIHCIRELHSYALPEIVALPIIGGDEEYLAWVRSSTI